MVLPASRRISRVLRYSGTGSADSNFVYGTVTLSGGAFQPSSTILVAHFRRPATPTFRRKSVWASPLSLATTQGIVFTFFSSGYLDVSVPRVPSSWTMNSSMGDGALPPPGFPIRRPTIQCLLAAPRGFSQLTASFFGSWRLGIHPVPFFA